MCWLKAKFHYAIWFEACRRPASNLSATSFEPASVVEIGFKWCYFCVFLSSEVVLLIAHACNTLCYTADRIESLCTESVSQSLVLSFFHSFDSQIISATDCRFCVKKINSSLDIRRVCLNVYLSVTIKTTHALHISHYLQSPIL